MPRLELSGVNAFYGEAQALHDIAMTIEDGEIVAVIGANGAGKTTLLKTISGLVHPRSGTIRYGADDLARIPAHDRITLGIAHVPEGRRLFRDMSVRENLMMGAHRRADTAETAADLRRIHALFPRLAEREKQLAGTLSGGEQQMAALGRALMARPRLLLLDEPSLGLAPRIVETLFEAIRKINETGVAIVLVEQNALLALETASRAVLMENGRILASGPSTELAGNDTVRAAYLGL